MLSPLHGLYDRIYVPDGVRIAESAARADVLCIGSHADDTEIMSFPWIRDCLKRRSFFSVVVSDGAGCPRDGRYGDVTDEEMVVIRKLEAREAADIGHYSGLATLGHPSGEVKSPDATHIVDELRILIEAIEPRVIITHQNFCKHVTHIATLAKTVTALTQLRMDFSPEEFIGGQVWGPIDQLPRRFIRIFDATDPDGLLPRLLSVFRSQCVGGKRYDEAFPDLFHAYRTLAESHKVDGDAETVMFGVDLLPLLEDGDGLSFVRERLNAYEQEVLERNELFFGGESDSGVGYGDPPSADEAPQTERKRKRSPRRRST
jgi:hypothetical protein